MDPVVTPPPAAPAPPATDPVTISATRDAANRGDFSAFEKADLASREGKPLADVAVTPDPDPKAAAPAPPADPVTPPPAESKPVSKRQEQINNYERQIAESNQRIQALEDQLRTRAPQAPSSTTPPAPAPTAIADPSDPEPDATDATKYPDGQYDKAFIRDLGAWSARTEHRRLSAESHAREQQSAAAKSLDARDQAFNDRVKVAKDADPEFITKLSPEVRALRPRDALQPGERVTPLNDVADFILRSDMPVRLMQHFTDHPADLERFRALPHRAAVTYNMGVLVGRLQAADATSAPPAAPTDPPAPPISAAPPPPPRVQTPSTTSDPKAAALARGDFATFDKLDMAERVAKVKGAA